MSPVPGVMKTDDTAASHGGRAGGGGGSDRLLFTVTAQLWITQPRAQWPSDATLWRLVTLQRLRDGVTGAGAHFLN